MTRLQIWINLFRDLQCVYVEANDLYVLRMMAVVERKICQLLLKNR